MTACIHLLHKQHTTNISFSTMLYHEGSKLKPYQDDQQMNQFTLDEAYKQIIELRKGGTCASLNKLFASLLKTLGYEIYAHKAKVMWGLNDKRPAAHRFSSIKIENNVFLIDIGFGGPGPKQMLMLYHKGQLVTESQGNGFFQYQFTIDHEGDIVLQHRAKDIWRDVYAFEQNKSYSEEEYIHQPLHVNQGIAKFRTQTFFATRTTDSGRLQMNDCTLTYKYQKDNEHHEECVTISPKDSLPKFLSIMDSFFGLKYEGPFLAKGKIFNADAQETNQEDLSEIITKMPRFK